MSVATEQVPIVVLPAHFLPGRAGHPPRTRAAHRGAGAHPCRYVCAAGPDHRAGAAES